MSLPSRLDPRTASSSQSIWQNIPEDTFRNHLVCLEERTNAVPIPSQVFSISRRTVPHTLGAHRLPLTVEQALADDFAYIAATGEGAQSVSAACIEEYTDPVGLRIRFAAIDAINEHLQHALREVGNILMQSASISSDQDDDSTASSLLELIVGQHFQKLLGRLRSLKWQKPKYLSRTHKKPLWQDFDNLVHRVQFVYPRKKDRKRLETETQLLNASRVFETFEDTLPGYQVEFTHLLRIIRASYTLCQSQAVKDYAMKLESTSKATPQIAAAIKTLRQIEKIGAYYRIAQDLVRLSKDYSGQFTNLSFEYLPTYSPITTDIGYESWARSLHVHAEVQLVVYYDTLSSQNQGDASNVNLGFWKPRTVGTSKYLCYLCYLFLKYHGMLIVRNTHGRLYDQWTIPDLATFGADVRRRYRRLIQDMDNEITSLSNELGPRDGKRDAWRVEPMTSRQNLLNPFADEMDNQNGGSRTENSST